MNNLAVILSHCDTSEKVDILRKLIKRLKNLGIDTLLCSHIPLEISIQQDVTYYIYDTDNPVLHWPENAVYKWEKPTGPTGPALHAIFPDYGWTVIDQIKKACNFALTLGCEFYSFINYDVMLTPELDSYILTAFTLNHPVVCTKSHDFPTTTLFTIVKKDALEEISTRINKNDYLKTRCAEGYWESLLSPYNVHTNAVPIETFDMTVMAVTHNQNYLNDEFEVFFQNGNMVHQEPHLTKAYFFNIKKDVSIQMQCNNQQYLIKKDSIIELPTDVTKLGFWKLPVSGVGPDYWDLLPEFNKAHSQHHNITDHENIDLGAPLDCP